MANRSRICAVCGVKYKYCPTCQRDIGKPTWMQQFHSENCKNIFKICTDYNLKKISKKEAQEQLSSCDLTNRDNFAPYVQRDLKEILG